jgi:hypothetical protein
MNWQGLRISRRSNTAQASQRDTVGVSGYQSEHYIGTAGFQDGEDAFGAVNVCFENDLVPSRRPFGLCFRRLEQLLLGRCCNVLAFDTA